MIFEAKGLPEGVRLDEKTGRFTGKAMKEGDYNVLLKATNSKGTAEKEVTVKVGGEIALTLRWDGTVGIAGDFPWMTKK